MAAVRHRRDLPLGPIHVLAALDDGALPVADHHVAKAHVQEQSRDGETRRARAGDDDAHVGRLTPRDLGRIDEAGGTHDGRAVLVVVEDGDVAELAQPTLDLEAARRRDVLEVDAAKALRDEVDGAHGLVHVVRVDAQGERVHVAKLLEEQALPLHDGHAGRRADVTQSQHGRAVGDDGDQVVSAREVPRALVVRLYGAAGLGHARGVEQGEVLGRPRVGTRHDLDLARKLLVQREAAGADVAH